MTSSMDLSQISLFCATREQILASRRRTHAQWAKGLPMPVYLQRDERLDQLDHTRDGRMRTWVLAPRSDPETLDFYCSCETYKRDAVVLEPSQSGVKEVTAYGIASVYTPEQNRRRGYAQHMMRLVHWVIANEAFRSSHPFPPAWGAAPTVPVGLGDGVFSVLYSDVGPKFYAGCGEADASGAGWQVSGPVSSIIPVISGSSITDDAGKWRILDPEECKAAWREDIGLMKKDVEHIAGNHAGHIIAAMLPTQGVAACQIFRTMDPTTGELPSQRWGVHLDESSSPSPTFATWGWELRATPKSMVVTRLRAPDVPHFQNLLQQLVRTAADAAVEQVEIWNVPEEFRASVATAGGKTFERDDHLPSIKYYDSSADAERVHFAFNEKYAWC